MNQPANNSPEISLPAPQAEGLPQPVEVARVNNGIEQDSARALEQGHPGDNPAVVVPGQAPVGLPSVAPPMPGVAQAVSTSSPHIADDADLIEKEWVEKAKMIVHVTKDDPYKQTKEMTRMKADYLKKRYNKDLKLG